MNDRLVFQMLCLLLGIALLAGCGGSTGGNVQATVDAAVAATAAAQGRLQATVEAAVVATQAARGDQPVAPVATEPPPALSSASGGSGKAAQLVHEAQHAVLVHRVPGIPTDLEMCSDDAAIGHAHDLGHIVDVDARVRE